MREVEVVDHITLECVGSKVGSDGIRRQIPSLKAVGMCNCILATRLCKEFRILNNLYKFIIGT